ncbi:MAG: flavin reductase family protein [Propionivibrio sp.]
MTDTDAPTNHARKPVCETCNNGSVLTAKGLCCKDFREALGRFPTGVTIVTALSPDGTPIGVTISSFNSVSLDPPLILWSLSTNSPKLEAFRQASHYAINVLASNQRELSNRFASRAEDRFADVDVLEGLECVPLIKDCCAWFECTHEAQYPGGDHLIFIGHVQRFAQGQDCSPLVFFDGAYHRLDLPESD